ncbi:MAG TPA: hypothetical protein VLS88_14190 [Polyangiales bacterium]|nr:hypothetical protein [Polyangiales bacterium]
MRRLIVLLPLAVLLACGESSSGSPSDAGVDGSADASVDASTDSGIDASADSGVDASVSERRIFVTETAQNADFGGLLGADALCASEAAAAGLDGVFKAWLSTTSSPVADRVTQSTIPYVLVDGTLIADDWDDLTDGDIAARINLDANGQPRGGDVWTGTLPNGLPYMNDAALDGGVPTIDCDGFESALGGVGLCGTTASTAANWTANATPACSTTLRLFCVEQ